MMNVLYICHAPDNLGGAALSLFNLIKSVKQHVNCIVVLGRKGVVSEFFKGNGIECIIADFPCNIRNNNFTIHITTFPLKYILNYLSTVVAIRKIKSAMKGRKVSIVHSNSSVFIFGDILSRTLRARHVWHFREFQDIDFNMHPFLGMGDLKRRMHRADALIAITKAVYGHWNFSCYANSQYMWDAVRSKNECVKIENKEKYYLFCAALLSKTKGVDSAIRAFGMSGMARDGYKLKIIGRCESESLMVELQCIANDYGIANSVEYLGYQKEIKPLMEKATAFIMASHNEGLGRVTIEAMFYGCLVIARRAGGTLEFLKEGYNGLYFDNDTHLASILKGVSSKIPMKIVDNAQKNATENFSEENYGIKILQIYQRVLSD